MRISLGVLGIVCLIITSCGTSSQVADSSKPAAYATENSTSGETQRPFKVKPVAKPKASRTNENSAFKVAE